MRQRLSLPPCSGATAAAGEVEQGAAEQQASHAREHDQHAEVHGSRCGNEGRERVRGGRRRADDRGIQRDNNNKTVTTKPKIERNM